MKSRSLKKLVVLIALLPLLASRAFADDDVTHIAKWHDDKKAVFLLMFDDSWPSQWQMAVPALVNHGLIATFYICPGKGEFVKCEDHWKNEVVKAGMVLANHTMTHRGVKDAESAD